MQILEDQEQRLLSCFPQQQALNSVKRALAPLGGVERLPSASAVNLPKGRHRYVEQGQQRRQRRLQRLVEREQLARHLVADVAEVVAVLDFEVAP